MERLLQNTLYRPQIDRDSVIETTLGAGDLITMEGMTQKYIHHFVPYADKSPYRKPRARINLTFRDVVCHRESCKVGWDDDNAWEKSGSQWKRRK